MSKQPDAFVTGSFSNLLNDIGFLTRMICQKNKKKLKKLTELKKKGKKDKGNRKTQKLFE